MAASSRSYFLSICVPSHEFDSKKRKDQLSFRSSSQSTPLGVRFSVSSSFTSFQCGTYMDGLAPVVTNKTPYSFDIFSVVWPSLLYENTFFFKSAYNFELSVGENESEESLLKRFRKEVMKTGVVKECKRRRFFESNQDKRKRKSRDSARREAAGRIRRRHLSSKTHLPPKKEDTSKNKKDEDDEEDNWELPEGDLPY